MDRNSVVAGCVPRKNRRPRARNPPASSPASPENSKSPRSPGPPSRSRLLPILQEEEGLTSPARKSSQVTAERSAGLKRSADGPTRPATATAGFTDLTITSPAKKIRSKRDKQARASPRRNDVKDENAKKLNDKLNSKLNTVTNGRVAKKKARRVRFKTAPGAPINSTQKIIHHYNNRRRNRVQARAVARVTAAEPTRRRRRRRAPPRGTDRRLRHAPAGSKVRAAHAVEGVEPRAFDDLLADAGRVRSDTREGEEWYADNLPAEVFAVAGGGTQRREEEYDEWVDGAAATPTPRPEYSRRRGSSGRRGSPAPHRGAVA